MNPEVAKIANSPILWTITVLAVSLVLVQSAIFLRKSIVAGRKIGLSETQLKTALKTGTISAVGPSTVIVIGMVSLLITVGAPTAMMRLSYVGNVVYELMAVGFATEAYGVGLSASEMTPEIFVTALWCMALGCIGYVLIPVLFTPRLEEIRNKIAGGNKSLIPVISSAAMLGAYAFFNAGYIVSLNKNTVALLVGFLVMTFMTVMYKKTSAKWINEWGLTISMVSGMLIAALF